jgi:hypothetical protein
MLHFHMLVYFLLLIICTVLNTENILFTFTVHNWLLEKLDSKFYCMF